MAAAPRIFRLLRSCHFRRSQMIGSAGGGLVLPEEAVRLRRGSAFFEGPQHESEPPLRGLAWIKRALTSAAGRAGTRTAHVQFAEMMKGNLLK